MGLRIQIIVGILTIISLVLIINMVRKEKMELKYALSWILVGIMLLFFDIFPQQIFSMSKLLGIVTPSNMVFFVGFCFSLLLIFSLTVAVSRLSERVKKLAQMLALYEYKEMEDKDEKK